ncbi:MAG: hypothetical protein AAEJ04_06285 [Planctomycetota bacterium]
MNNENVNPSDEFMSPDVTKQPAESEVVRKPVREAQDTPVDSDLSEFTGVDDDEMIVLLDDVGDIDSAVEAEESSSTTPVDDLIFDELEELPELSVELIDDLPEVEDVEDITSLVEGFEEEFDNPLLSNKEVVLERIKEWAVEYWKPGIAVASLFVAMTLALSSSPWFGSDNASAEFSKAANAAVNFEEWVDEILDQHMAGTGTEK